jgi:hypothetical protein
MVQGDARADRSNIAGIQSHLIAFFEIGGWTAAFIGLFSLCVLCPFHEFFALCDRETSGFKEAVSLVSFCVSGLQGRSGLKIRLWLGTSYAQER